MRKSLIILVAAAFALAFVAGPAAAYWEPAMGHKMHFPQLPDEDGWDVNSSLDTTFALCCTTKLADDFLCMETGWIKDIHWWGSWMGGMEGFIDYFRLEIYSNIDTAGSFSKPDTLLWWYEAPFDELHVEPITSALPEGWYCPCCGLINPADHYAYYQYNLLLPEQRQFCQEQETVYWLSIQAVIDTLEEGCWGWKTADVELYPSPYTGQHYMDDAVYSCAGGPWMELMDPIEPVSLDLAFVITGDDVPPAKVPSLSELGLIILALLLAAAGVIAVIRRRTAVARVA